MSSARYAGAPEASSAVASQEDVERTASAHVAAISARNLSKVYGSRRALRPLTLELAAGEALAIVGPNGAGKSTLIRLLATLSRPTTGELAICGFSTMHDAQEARRRIGVLLHESLLYPDLSVEENLRFFARIYGIVQADERTAAVLAAMHLLRLRGTRVRQLSHGQRQRASLARALIHDPAVLMLDEPDAGLDAASFERLCDMLASDPRRTIVFSTHQPAHALALGQRLLLLRDGRASDLGATAGWTSADLQQAIL